MSFYPLFEEVRKGSEAKTVRDEIVKKFPQKYMTHSASNRVKNSGNVTSEDFRKDLEEVANELGLQLEKTEIIPPGRAANPKAQSDSFDTIHITLKDNKDFGIILASLAGRGKTSTIFKEGMVCFFFGADSEYKPFKKSSEDTEEQYYQLMEKIYNDIDQNGIQGMDDKQEREIKEFIQNKGSNYDSATLNAIFNAMSIGNFLRVYPMLGNWEIRRDKLFEDLKKKGGQIANVPTDKWNPMDVMLIKKGSESEIRKRMKEAEEEDSKDSQLGGINQLFMDSLTSKNPKSIVLAISLKEEEAQAGKAKSYVDNLKIKEGMEYNLTDDEKSWAGKDKKIQEEILKLREKIKDLIEEKLSDKFLYKLGGPISEFEGKNLLGKYGALKMLLFFLHETIDDDNIFIDLASYGLSLGVNPTFFKFIGNKDGDKNKVKENIIIFPAEGGVTLYNTPDSSYDKKIWVVDNNGNSGIKIIYWVEFSSWVYVVHILIRSNQPTMKVAQVTVEIERFDKLKDLR
jgi:hypothetical protein